MSVWSERAEQLLFDGETIDTEVAVGPATVVVTSHRLLAFTPQADGKDYRAVDRPNVRDVERRAVYGLDYRERAIKLGVVAAILLVVGVILDPESLLPKPDVSGAGSAAGFGDVLGIVDRMIGLFHALDALLIGVGVLLAVVAVALGALQLSTRSVVLAVDVAGEDPITLPKRVDPGELERLQAAIEPPATEEGPDSSSRQASPAE